jgi:hypothetical protein
MTETISTKRELFKRATVLLAGFGLTGLVAEADAQTPAKTAVPLDFEGKGAIPWIRRIFHLYTGPDGLSRIEQLPVVLPNGAQAAQLLRRTADRVTIGGSAPHAGYGYHVASQPTLLIPIFGSMIVELGDGKEHELIHGDIAIAEDCSGKGHISRAGAQGSFMVAVQLPKAGCPTSGSSDMTKFWTD